MKIYIGGCPSYYGGADTEVLHLGHLLSSYGHEMHVVPMFGCDDKMKLELMRKGWHFHDFTREIFKDQIVLSFCNGSFLGELAQIHACGKPKAVIWANTMSFNFHAEEINHLHGYIDYHVYSTEFQRSRVKPKLEAIRPVKELVGYRQFYDLSDPVQGLKFQYRQPTTEFVFGRLSRDDGNKYSKDTWKIFGGAKTPDGLKKKVYIMGFGQNAARQCGKPPEDMDGELLPPAVMPVSEFYGKLHCLIHKTAGKESNIPAGMESYGRTYIESLVCGVPFICEDAYSYPELVVQNETGIRCQTNEEFIEAATMLAHNEAKRKEIIFNGHDYVRKLMDPETCYLPWYQLLKTLQ